MTSIDDLRDQLERLGRRPVPMPRPEFADELLRKLQSGETTDVLPMPTPIGNRQRRRGVPARLVALGSIAAALLLVVGLFSITGGGGEAEQEFSFSFVEPTPIGSSTVEDVKVDERGTILGEGVQDGVATATCETAGQFRDAAGKVYTCAAGDTWEVRIKDRQIVEAHKVPSSTSVQVATAQTEAPTTTAAPQTTPPSTSTSVPTTATTTSSTPTTSVVTTSTSTTKPPPQEGAPTTTAPANVDLTFKAQPGDKQIDFSWTQYTGADFGRYVMVRSTGVNVVYPIAGESQEIWSSDDPTSVRFKESDLPLGADIARYQLFVVDRAGKVLAKSEVVKVELSLGPSTSSTSAPPTTATTPTSTTTEQPKSD